MNELNRDEIMVLERIIVKPELQSHFFSKIKHLKWFEVLKDKGLLEPSSNPSPINTDGDYWNIPSWPVTEYLVRSSEILSLSENAEYAKAYMALIRDVTIYAKNNNFSNYRTWWQFAKILKFLPVEFLTSDDIGLIDYWLDDRFDRYLIGKELGVWLDKLLESPDTHAHHLAMLLLDRLFHVDEVNSKYDSNKKDPIFRIDAHWLDSLTGKTLNKIVTVLGFQSLDFFEKKLIQALDISGNDKWSTIWRHAIESHDQNVVNNDVVDVLLQFYRDVFIALYQEMHEIKHDEYFAYALNSKYQLIQRTAIYVASESCELLNETILLKIITPVFFNDNYRHELWSLLNKNFTKFGVNVKNVTLVMIDDLSEKNDDGCIDESATAYKKSVWYSAIKEYDISASKKYNKCIAITKSEPEHPDFACYSSVFSGAGKSPVSLVDLRIMFQEPLKMVSFLNEYDHVGHFGEPGIEGLVKVFGELVEVEIEHVLDHGQNLLKLKPYYQHEFFSAFDNAWRDKKNLKWDVLWPELLKFTQALLIDDEFWHVPTQTTAPYDSFIGNTNWVVNIISQLIEAGCKSDESSFGIENISLAKSVLECILEKISGEEFSMNSDAVSFAINSPRGRCLSAYINLALYECRNLTQVHNDHATIWTTYEHIFNDELTRPEINEYEFSVLVAMYLSNFLYLSKNWLSINLELIFGEVSSQRWLCAIQGFCYTSGFDSNVYSLFKRKHFFEELLDSHYLNDEVKGQLIKKICLVHLWGHDELNSSGSPLSLLINRGNYNELRKIVWWFWSIHDEAPPKARDIVFKLYPALVNKTVGNDRDAQLLASELCLWITYIDTLDVDTISWLSTIAPYADKAQNANVFLGGLSRLSSAYPLEVSVIWKIMLKKYRPIYDDDVIKTLFDNIIKIGADGRLSAKEIADLYLTHGAFNIVSIYRQSTKE